MVRILRRFLRPYRRYLAGVAVAQLVQITATLLLPTLYARIVDDGVVAGRRATIAWIGALMVGVVFVQLAAASASVAFGSRAAMGMGRDLRAAVFRQVQTFSVREVGQLGAASLITRTVTDVQQIQSMVTTGFNVGVSAPIMGVGAILMALSQDVSLSVLLMALIPTITVVSVVILVRMRPLYRLMQLGIDQVNRMFREQITGVRVVRAFVREHDERMRVDRVNQELFTLTRGVGRLVTAMFPAVLLVMNVFGVLLLWVGGHRVDAGVSDVGSLNAFLGYLSIILVSCIMTMMMLLELPHSEVCARRIAEVLATTGGVVAPDHPVHAMPAPGCVLLRGVGFRYPGAARPVLHDIDLEAGPGETVAIVGGTGSGKTTLVNLVVRLCDVTDGQVMVHGIDVRGLDLELLRGGIGLVPQQPYLFSGTIADNLRYGRPAATDAELWHALEVAQARDFVAGLPDGLQTEVAQGGTTISGGQRQRLSIARALVRRPRIYLFDDCFSALDYATDRALRDALRPEVAEATVIVVAQRVATIRSASRIAVLDAGRIVGVGSHAQLLATCPTYREIALSQLSEEEAA